MRVSEGSSGLSGNPFTAMDQTRRLQGALLEAAGWGPVQAESEVVFSRPGVRLRSYPAAGGEGAAVLAVVIAVLSYWPVRNMASSGQRMNTSFDPLRLVNSYGAFGRVTKERLEVVIQGTAATTVDRRTVWREYEFKAKPGDPSRRPPQIAPYHLRLDWLMWFAALPRRFDDRWLRALLRKLLENDRPSLNLLRKNPFPDEPPAVVRARLYRYCFSSPAERQETGVWWARSPVRTLIQPMHATSLRRSGGG